MCGGAFDGEARVDVVMGGGGIGIDIGEVIVEVGIVGSEVTAEEGSVGGEDGGDWETEVGDSGYGDAAHPFVEMGEDALSREDMGEVAEEFGDGEAEGDDLIDLAIGGDGGDAVVFPHEVFVNVEARIACAVVEEDDTGSAGDEPVAVVTGHAFVAEFVEDFGDVTFCGAFFELDSGGGGVVGPDEAIAVAPMVFCDGGLGAEDGVDAAELPADFPCDFEEQGLCWL